MTTGIIIDKKDMKIDKQPEVQKIPIYDFKKFGKFVLDELDTIPENEEEFGNVCYFLGQSRERIRQIFVKLKNGEKVDWELY